MVEVSKVLENEIIVLVLKIRADNFSFSVGLVPVQPFLVHSRQYIGNMYMNETLVEN